MATEFILDQFGKIAQVIVEGVVDAGITAGLLTEAPEAVIAERLAICAACPEFTGDRCKQCGCFMLPKSRLAAAQCPMDKWGKLEPTQSELQSLE